MQIQPTLRTLIIGLLSIYLCIYPFSILLISFDRVPTWGTWMGGALLVLQGTMMGAWLVLHYGWRGVGASISVLLLGWAIEHIGVKTGFPFGTYSYTDVLVPKLWGVVPLAIPFAWLLVVPAAIGITDYLNGTHGHLLLRAWRAASFALLLDITIEPVAVHINGYWVWDHEGSYYGVPLSNFVAWWGTSIVLVGVVLWFTERLGQTSHRDEDQSASISTLIWLPPLMYVLNLMMFALVNLSHDKVLPAAIGGILLLYLVFPREGTLGRRMIQRWRN